MKELCVRCGKETKYDTSTPITLRRYFIEGAGQLCSNCWAKLWPTRRQKNTMTIVRFAEMHRVTVKTVQDWIAKGYIPGATETSVPDSARRPYTKTRAKKGEAIIKSILTACDNELGTCAALYSISPASYDAYIQSLLDSGYIIQFEDESLTYYNITASGADLLRNWNKNDVLGAIQAGAAVGG